MAKIPKYCLHKASGQAYVTLNSKTIYLGPYDTAQSKAEYDRVIAEWLAAGKEIGLAPSKLRTGVLCHLFWDQHGKTYYLTRGKIGDYWRWVKNIVFSMAEQLGSVPVASLLPKHLIALRHHWVTRSVTRQDQNLTIGTAKRKVRGLGRSKANSATRIAVEVIRWGVEQGHVPSAVLEGFKAVKPLQANKCGIPEPEPIGPVPQEHIDAVLAIASKRYADMIRVQLLTGMRPGELCLMRVSHIDQSQQPWRYIPPHHKTEHKSKQRVIMIGPKAQEILKPWIERANNMEVFEKGKAKATAKDCPIFPTSPASNKLIGKPRCNTSQNYRDRIASLCDRAKVPRWSPNQLRHNAATLIRAAAGLDSARSVLGHSSTSTTEIYAEKDWTIAAKIISEIG